MKTYMVQTQCDNCNAWFHTEIQKGVTVGDFRKENETVTCSHCCCKTNFGRIL